MERKKVFAGVVIMALFAVLAWGAWKESGNTGQALAEESDFEIDYEEYDVTLVKYTGHEKNVVIPEGVTFIESDAFAGCNWIESVTIPASYGANKNHQGTVFPPYAFDGCDNLMDFDVDLGNENYYAIDGIVYSDYEGGVTLGSYPVGRKGNYEIQEGISGVGSFAFCGCEGLSGIVIPDSVRFIDREAFSGCIGLKEIDIPKNVQLGPYAFANCSNLKKININSGVELMKYAFGGCKSLEEVVLNNASGMLCFSACSGLKKVVIKKGKLSFSEFAFSGCVNLEEINVPSYVKDIYDYCFGGCSSLTSIKLPKNLKQIYMGAFSGCSSLTDINLPSKMTHLWNWAFENCSSLVEIKLPAKLKKLDRGVFKNCSSLLSIKIPSKIKEIQGDTFKNCTSLKKVTIPASVKKIRKGAFKNCSHLVIYCKKDSYAHKYAKRKGIKYVVTNPNAKTKKKPARGYQDGTYRIDSGGPSGGIKTFEKKGKKLIIEMEKSGPHTFYTEIEYKKSKNGYKKDIEGMAEGYQKIKKKKITFQLAKKCRWVYGAGEINYKKVKEWYREDKDIYADHEGDLTNFTLYISVNKGKVRGVGVWLP